MRRRLPALFAAALIAGLLTYATPADIATAAGLSQWTGTVERIVDGDTFEVRLESQALETVRVAGINTNETGHAIGCWADEATDRLATLIDGKQVVLKAQDANSTAQGRKIRHVFINGVNVAEKMLSEGYGVPLIFVNQEPDFANSYLDAFWSAVDAGLRIADPSGCGNGPQQNLDIDMVTIGDADGIDSSNLNGEYVDIINNGGSPLDLDGWALHDSAVDYFWFPSGTQIGPGSRLRVHVGSGSDTSSDIYMGFGNPIFSPMDGAFLLDPDEDLRAFDAWPCSGRCGPPHGDLVIEDVIYDGPGNDDADPNVEQIVVTNQGTASADFTDWRVESSPYTLHIQSGTIAPGASATIQVGTGSNGGGIYHWGKTSSILNNEGDQVLLVTPDGDIQDCASWGTGDCSATPANRADGSDLDGDGYDDVVAGAPGEAIGSRTDAGAANLIFGSIDSLHAGGNILLRQGGSSLPGSAEAGDEFGSAVTYGDFNRDGYADSVIGSPHEDVGGSSSSGLVTVVPGGRFGPVLSDAVNISQAGPVPGAAEANDLFGSALAAGDFNGDAFDDLAIGVPGEDLNGVNSAGSVVVLFGSSAGLVLSGISFSQKGPIPGGAESGDKFGTALSVGDFDADGYDDIVVSAPFEDLGSISDAGNVAVIPGSPSGPDENSAFAFSQSGSVPGAPEAGDKFGRSLATGDLNGDHIDDLVIGVPGEALGTKTDAGLVTILFGSGSGLVIGGVSFSQSGSYPGSPEKGDEFGKSVAVADMDDDGFEDIIVGAPGEDLASKANTGALIVVFTNSGGPKAGGSRMYDMGDWGVGLRAGQKLGTSIRTGDFNGDGHFDAAAGAPGAKVDGISSAGRIVTLDGSATGSTPGSDWDQRPLAGTPEANDNLGYLR